LYRAAFTLLKHLQRVSSVVYLVLAFEQSTGLLTASVVGLCKLPLQAVIRRLGRVKGCYKILADVINKFKEG